MYNILATFRHILEMKITDENWSESKRLNAYNLFNYHFWNLKSIINKKSYKIYYYVPSRHVG